MSLDTEKLGCTGDYLTFIPNTPIWVIEAAKKLGALEKLELGWDSHGGLPLNQGSRALSVNVLRWLELVDLPIPAFVLGSEGHVYFEWRKSGRELDVEIGEATTITFVKTYPDGTITEDQKQANLPEELRGLANWLIHGEAPSAP